MPKRLGDDPLSRKRESSKNLKDDPAGELARTQETSHNDVFFRRRTDDQETEFEGALEQPDVEKPEISEVNDIVKVAEIEQSVKKHRTHRPKRITQKTTIAENSPTPAPELVTVAPEHLTTEASQSGALGEPQKPGFFRRLFGRFGKQR